MRRRTNEDYKRRALKTRAQEILEGERASSTPAIPWEEIMVLFHAVDRGKADWGIPAYVYHQRLDRVLRHYARERGRS